MVEGILSWIFLIIYTFNHDSNILIACAIFAVAAQIGLKKQNKEEQ